MTPPEVARQLLYLEEIEADRAVSLRIRQMASRMIGRLQERYNIPER